MFLLGDIFAFGVQLILAPTHVLGMFLLQVLVVVKVCSSFWGKVCEGLALPPHHAQDVAWAFLCGQMPGAALVPLLLEVYSIFYDPSQSCSLHLPIHVSFV